MKKTVKKLGLARETLRGLDGRSMKDVAGGDTIGCTTYNTGGTDTLTCAFCGPTPVVPGETQRTNCWAN
jgi:hypothetical protein